MHEFNIDAMAIDQVIDRIIALNRALARFWGTGGWASGKPAQVLSQSRLDWQVSLSHALKFWVQRPSGELESAHQILGYVNLGSLVEGVLKLCLSVWYYSYETNENVKTNAKGDIVDPDRLKFEDLKQFFKKSVWVSGLDDNWDRWLDRIQARRNAIHAYRDRPIGTYGELVEDIRHYLRFLCRVNSTLPYPDGGDDGPATPVELAEVYFGAEPPVI